jgi:hypothetical protein
MGRRHFRTIEICLNAPRDFDTRALAAQPDLRECNSTRDLLRGNRTTHRSDVAKQKPGISGCYLR